MSSSSSNSQQQHEQQQVKLSNKNNSNQQTNLNNNNINSSNSTINNITSSSNAISVNYDKKNSTAVLVGLNDNINAFPLSSHTAPSATATTTISIPNLNEFTNTVTAPPSSPPSSNNSSTLISSSNLNNNNNNQLQNSQTSSSSSNANSTNNNNSTTPTSNNANMTGYLNKWTNYIKGYQKRWFSLNNGLLSYYRNPNEAEHTCRGTINLANATIQSEDACHFVVSNNGAQTFHLKAATEVEKQKWVNALEMAKNKARQYNSNNNSNLSSGVFNSMNQQVDSDDEESLEAEKHELENMLKALQHKLNELSLSHEFVLKQSTVLNKSLNELENIQTKPDESTIKTINERSTVYKIAMLGVVNHCQEFINLAQFQTRKMHRVLQSEREARTRLEEMVQEMAKQHLNIETQLTKRGKRSARGPSNNPVIGVIQNSTSNNSQVGCQQILSSTDQRNSDIQTASNAHSQLKTESNNKKKEDSDDEDNMFNDDEFHDAVEDVTQFSVTLPRQKTGLHHRNPSNISKLYLQESDISSDEEDHQTIQVTMHTNKDTNAPLPQIINQHKTNQNKHLLHQSAGKKQSSADLNSLKGVVLPPKNRRKEIVPRPNYSLNLWSIMKNCIGKDLSKIPIPVNFSEPLSMLQRVTEELEYSNLLDIASECEDQWEQLAYVAAFTITSYSTTSNRTNKPFNPILGETYECDRLDDLGWRSLCEQVSHHPPGFAMHAESLKDWSFYQEFTMSSKFRGQYLQIIPLGTSHLVFKKSGNHYTWRKVATFVRNIIVGKLWIDNVGEMDIINHKTKDVCHLKYFPYSYFSKDPPRKVTGIITDANNVARYVLNGTWLDQMEGAPVLNPQVVTEQTQLNTGASKVLWRRRVPPAYLETMYNFTELAVQLNEPEVGVAPTDTRLRPDQRLMEDGKWDEANKEKLRLEEKQRNARKQREMLALENVEKANNNNDIIVNGEKTEDSPNKNEQNTSFHDYEPLWFKKVIDPITNQSIHVFNNQYWDCKIRNDWKRCPDLF